MQRQNNYRSGNRNWRRSSGNYNDDRYNNPGYASYDYNEGYRNDYRQSRRSYGSGDGNYGDRSSHRNFFDRAGDKMRETWNDRNDRDRDDYRYNRNRGNYSNQYDHEKNDSSRNYRGERNNDNFFKRAGRKIRDTWNDWAYGDYDHNDRYNSSENRFNEYDPDNIGYQGRNSSDYRTRRYSDNDYYNPSDNYSNNRRNRSYHETDYSSAYSPYGRSSRGSDYGYYESYPRHGNSSRYANQNVRPYQNRVNHRNDEYYNTNNRNSGWSNAYTPMSDY